MEWKERGRDSDYLTQIQRPITDIMLNTIKHRARRGSLRSRDSNILIPQVGVLLNEVSHHGDALAVLHDHADDSVLGEEVLCPLKCPVFADHDFGNLVQEA